MTLWAPQPGPQLAAIEADWCPELLYGGARGGGKGLRPSEPVLTPVGWKAIGELKGGDKLCAVDGTVTHVLAVYRRRVQPFYRCHLSDGSAIDCDGDHIWFGWRANQTRKIANERTWGKEAARKYSMGELLSFVNSERDRHGYATNRFAIPVPAPVAFNVAGSLVGKGNFVKREVDPYVLGVLLGDGSLGNCTPSFCSADQEVVDEVARRLAGIAELSLRPSSGAVPSYGIVNGGALKAQLERVGVWGMRCEEKSVPRIYLMGSVDERWDLLRGLMDTDGWAETDGDIYFASTSRRLAEDVRHLAWSLGGVVTWREKAKWCTYKGERRDGLPAYEVRLKFADSSLAFTLPRKRDRCIGKAPQNLCRHIERIDPIEPSESVCISVAHPSSLYITRDYIVTHNSDFLLGDWLQDVSTYGPLWQGIIFRRTYDPELRETMLRAHGMFPMTGGSWREGDREWHWPNGAKLRLRYLERPEDATRYQGASFTWIGFDEVGQWPTDEGYRAMIGTLRSPGAVPTKRMRSTANPGGAGHQWVKARFIDPAPGGYVTILDKVTGMERLYIPSRVSDNRIMLRSDPGYASRLRGVGSEALVRAWLEGDWDVVEGAYFDNWRGHEHVVRPCALPGHWTRFRAIDWGSARPFAVGWFTVSDGELPEFPKGAVVMYREWYGMREGQPNVGIKMDAEDVAAGILERQDEDEHIAYGVGDPSMWKSDSGPSVAERFFRMGVPWRKADNQRVAGWQQLRMRLNGEDGRPMLYVFSTCSHLVRTLPAMQHDDHRPEDVDTDGEDHAADMLRYAMMSRPYAAPVEHMQPPRFLQEATFDEIMAEHSRLRGSGSETRV